jgi:hypothetical protein
MEQDLVITSYDYRGFTVEFEAGEGWHWTHGGYFDAEDECFDEIDNYLLTEVAWSVAQP